MKSLLRDVAAWSLMALTIAAMFTYYDDVKRLALVHLGMDLASIEATKPQPREVTQNSNKRIELRSSQGGHFLTAADINGRRVDVMVDTGATVVAMTFEDAQKAGVFVRNADFTHSVSTANGQAKVAPIMLQEVRVGELRVRNVAAIVSEPGKLQVTLLGMSFLSRLQRVDMRSGTLILQN